MADVLVVGAGLAGARTCDLLRGAGLTGRLVLIGAEAEPPYDRPPLTKDPGVEVDLRSAMGLDVWAAADEVRLGVRAERLTVRPGEPAGLVVACSDGTELAAGAVVVATGANPVVPAGWQIPGTHVLHTRSGAGSLWADVRPGGRLAIVGGGWIGCEAAATAAGRGAHVDVFEAAGQLLAGRVPPEVARRIATWLADAGVEVHVATPIGGIATRDGAVAVAGLTADVALVALGVRPATGWLAGSGVGLTDSGAVRVDPWGRSTVPGVFAVGDAADRWSPRYAAHLPGGHWTEALNAPEAVAPVVADWAADGAGDRAAGDDPSPRAWTATPSHPAPDRIPYVFSDIGGRRLLVLGAPAAGRRVVWRESAGDAPEEWSAFTLDASERLVGMCTAGRPRDLVAARRAMTDHPRGTPRVDPGALADPTALPRAMFPAFPVGT